MFVSGDPEFVAEMELEPVSDGVYAGRISDRFNAPVMPQGGITTALALRAATESLGRPDQQLCSTSTVFAGQVPAGDVEIETEVIRAGRSASQVRATIRPVDGDRGGHVVMATFAIAQDDVIVYAPTTPPNAPPPEECVDRWEAEAPDHPELVGPRPTFFDHFEGRHVNGHLPWDPPWKPTEEPILSWLRWRDTPREEPGRISPLGLVPPCDTMPGAVFERHGFDERWFLVPSVDLTVQIFDTRLDEQGWMLKRNTSRWAGHGLAAADVEMFSEDGRLLAYATQLMHVRLADREAVTRRMIAAGDTHPVAGA